MSILLRAALYALCLFLVMIVYTGQKQATAAATLRAAARGTVRLLAWTVVGAAIMLGLEFAFID